MPKTLADAQLNLFADTYKPIPIATVTLAEALASIQNGMYAKDLAYVRHMLARGEQSYRAAKNRLHAFTFAGTFAPSRLNVNLEQHTGIVHGDLDKLADVLITKSRICADPRTVYAFISPRGDGLKVGVRVPTVSDDAAYKHAWQMVCDVYAAAYGGKWDATGKDIARLCYVSLDPDLYTKFDAEVFDVPPESPPEPRPQPQRASITRPRTDHHDFAEHAIQTAVQMIQSAPMGTRHHTRLRAARLLGGYVAGGMLSEERAYGVLAQALVGYTEDLPRALRTVEDGLRYGQARPIQLQDLERERQAWLDQHRSLSSHTPYKASPEDPWTGRRTLPLRPYTGLRMPREVRRG